MYTSVNNLNKPTHQEYSNYVRKKSCQSLLRLTKSQTIINRPISATYEKLSSPMTVGTRPKSKTPDIAKTTMHYVSFPKESEDLSLSNMKLPQNQNKENKLKLHIKSSTCLGTQSLFELSKTSFNEVRSNINNSYIHATNGIISTRSNTNLENSKSTSPQNSFRSGLLKKNERFQQKVARPVEAFQNQENLDDHFGIGERSETNFLSDHNQDLRRLSTKILQCYSQELSSRLDYKHSNHFDSFRRCNNKRSDDACQTENKCSNKEMLIKRQHSSRSSKVNMMKKNGLVDEGLMVYGCSIPAAKSTLNTDRTGINVIETKKIEQTSHVDEFSNRIAMLDEIIDSDRKLLQINWSRSFDDAKLSRSKGAPIGEY